MSFKQNLHTHTIYCDGKNTPEELICAALDKGFDSLGFSGHSPMSYDDYVPDRLAEYKAHIGRLKREYKDQIKLYLGLEVDLYSGPECDLTGFDYLIGAVHDLRKDGIYFSIDESAENVRRVCGRFFNGDGLAMARAYYQALATLPEYGRFDIIAHFDLITKYMDVMPLYDATSRQYYGYAFEAARALAGKIPFFEVNTGAMVRGYRTTPYPDAVLIRELRDLGFGAVISSDCHVAQHLDAFFDESAALLRQCGYREHYVLTDDGFVPVPL